jgi:hypothetical protein
LLFCRWCRALFASPWKAGYLWALCVGDPL